VNAPFNPRGQVRTAFTAFVSDPTSLDAARAAANALDWPVDHLHQGGLRDAIQSLAVAASPHVLLVDASDSVSPMDDINALAEVCEPGTIVIACGHLNDIRFYRDLLQSGIHDYLHKPFTSDHLRETILQAQAMLAGSRQAEAENSVPHAQIAVIGVRGGVGSSSLAVSLAWTLSQRDRSAALLDLDVHFGTGALALDLEPGRGLTDAIENPSRIDGLFIERALVRANDALGVLSAEAPISQPLSGDGTAFFQLQDELRNSFTCSVIDLPRHMLVQHPALLHETTAIVLVTELTLAATRDTIRLLSWLKGNAPRSKLVVVANKVPAAGQEEVQRKEFEKSIEHKLDLVLPLDAKLAAQAAKLGKPLMEVAKAAKLGQAMEPLAAAVLGEEALATGKSGKKGASGGSLLGRLGGVKSMLPTKRKG
jgi:pilus assembly protein CpaE